jgi:hypothetical protein
MTRKLVMPRRHVNDLAHVVAEYLAGDSTKLKWLIDFKNNGR